MRYEQAKYQTVAHRADVSWVVIHTMELPCRAGIADRLAKRFADGSRKVSAHYCIDPSEVIQCVREENVAWHCPKANRRGIGLEHAGYAFGGASHDPTDWASPDGQAVLQRSAELVARICQRWDIPVVRLLPGQILHGRGIFGHEDATHEFQTPGGHRDPGPNWPWDQYIDMIRKAIG